MGVEFNTEDMLDTYLFENGQLLENLQEIVLEQKDEEYFDEDSINEIFRTMHTIKGSSAIMMYDDITAIAHKLEDVFYFLRESRPKNVPHVELVEHVLQVSDFITAELDKIQNGEEADGDASSIIAELDKFLEKLLLRILLRVQVPLIKCSSIFHRWQVPVIVIIIEFI